jgi:hypothetical protein
MSATNRKLFLLTTASVEAGTVLCPLFLPAGLFAILLGLERVSVQAIFVGRIVGAPLLALGVACWVARGRLVFQLPASGWRCQEVRRGRQRQPDAEKLKCAAMSSRSLSADCAMGRRSD